MKIGLVLSGTPAYSETFFNSKIKGLQENGFEVVLFVQHHNPNFQLCRVKKASKVYKNSLVQGMAMLYVLLTLIRDLKNVIPFIKLERTQKISYLQLTKKVYLNAHILKEQLDWLHFGFATIALGKENLAKSMNAKLAVSFRGYDINVYPLKFPNCYQLLWRRVDKVHSISTYLLHEAYALGLRKNIPYEIIPPAVDMSNIKERVIDQSFKNRITMVTIARLHWMKGLDKSITAVKILKDLGYVIDYKIIGDGIQKDLERYQYQVYELDLTKEVSFLGKLSHCKTLEQLKESSIYVQPSFNEGFCNALLEAQAYGKLCVAYNVGGIPENIEDKKSGWLVEGDSGKELALKLEEIINLTQERKNQIRKYAQNRVKEQFNLEKQALEFREFYTVLYFSY